MNRRSGVSPCIAERCVHSDPESSLVKLRNYTELMVRWLFRQERLLTRVEYSSVRIALVTARNSPLEMRVIKTLRSWGEVCR